MCFKHSPILLKDTPGACGRGHLFDECTAPVIRASASRRRRRVTPRAPRTYHPHMSNGDLHWIANYIWGIADDVLRDLYVRGKYRDVILPMTVLRRLDAVLVESKPNVLEMKAVLDQTGVVEQDAALRQAAGQAFYNTSKFTLRDLRARASRQQLRADFEAYLDGFSPNVQDILENFEFSNQIPRLRRPRLGYAHREAHLAGHQPQPRPGKAR